MYCSIFAEFLSGDDSFGTFSKKSGCTELSEPYLSSLKKKQKSAHALYWAKNDLCAFLIEKSHYGRRYTSGHECSKHLDEASRKWLSIEKYSSSRIGFVEIKLWRTSKRKNCRAL